MKLLAILLIASSAHAADENCERVNNYKSFTTNQKSGAPKCELITPPISDNTMSAIQKANCEVLDSDIKNSCALNMAKKKCSVPKPDYQKNAEEVVASMIGDEKGPGVSKEFVKGTPEYNVYIQSMVDELKSMEKDCNALGYAPKAHAVKSSYMPLEYKPGENAKLQSYKNRELEVYSKIVAKQPTHGMWCGTLEHAKNDPINYFGLTSSKGMALGSKYPESVWQAGPRGASYIPTARTCYAEIKQVYADNESNVDIEKLKKDGSIQKCLNDNPGMEVSEIKITTSSSLEYNTQQAYRECCMLGFKCLSERRAQKARDAIKNDPDFARLAGKIDSAKLDFMGTNGDGTSGECPYEIDYEKSTETRLVQKDRKGFSKNKTELDPSKTLKVAVVFALPPTPPDQVSPPPKYSITLDCKTISYRCGDRIALSPKK